MRILLDDGMQIPLGTGIGKYSEHLARALANAEDVSVDVLAYKPKALNRRNARLEYLGYINSAGFARKAESYDLCIFTNYAMPFRKLKTRTAVTIHDLAVYDCPETLPRAYVPYGRTMIRNATKKADSIVTVSKTMLDAIIERFPYTERKATYAWPGVYDHVGVSDKDNPYDDSQLAKLASNPFFLMVGTVEKRKNIEFVIEAFSKYKEQDSERKDCLILAGRPGFGFAEIESRANISKCRDSIIFTGYISDNDCKNLYRDARAQIFPSVYEGFGSTQIESMVMGLPCVLSDIPTNREISTGWGYFFELGNVDSLIKAMTEALESNRNNNDALKMVRERFNWSHVSNSYLAMLGK